VLPANVVEPDGLQHGRFQKMAVSVMVCIIAFSEITHVSCWYRCWNDQYGTQLILSCRQEPLSPRRVPWSMFRSVKFQLMSSS